ncbi:hypothetical protein [Parasphingopyxis marina]|uniref:Uncharacterized protein n=1 Tax=Parasphingopyxis marina TaxID=2761622 RepID=A0A842HU61_9SPHN|nr:hypothetical protein [Parasphingopyxis marina]MBC2776562.1 hypothetical protein [Parasphingopyxis marina]
MEKVGLLFVHGIGQQERFEHLRTSVREYAELIKDAGAYEVAVTDRTAGWKRAPGDTEYGENALAPMTVSVIARTKERAGGEPFHIEIECHEVWWADLGGRETLSEKIAFWWWGLGQWSAPIFRELDPTGTSHVETGDLRRGEIDEDAKAKPGKGPLTAMPRSSAGNFLVEVGVRARLSLAGLCALFTLFSWALLKRLLGFLADAPSTTLIFQYIGDVRTYERRAAPNNSLASDPGQPLRVPIRRRMVAEMVGMATRGYARWYISAHSLGTVLAYNGITEIGHALPNYLSQAQWNALPAPFKSGEGVGRRDESDLHLMMPARPAWLGPDEVVNRRRLFKGLHGLLTYGSPLDKFAAIWPRIVASATDCIDGKPPFRGYCRWINLNSANDPVSGKIDSFSDPVLERVLPALENYGTTHDALPGLSHIRYFRSRERSADTRRIRQRREIMHWLIDGPDAIIGDDRPRAANARAAAQFVLIIVALSLLTGAVAVFAGGAMAWFGIVEAAAFSSLSEFWERFGQVWPPATGIAFALLALAGVSRWLREARLNAILARADGKGPVTRAFLRSQAIAAALCFLGTAAAILLGVAIDFCAFDPAPIGLACLAAIAGYATLAASAAAIAASFLLQAAINRLYTRPAARPKPGR